MFCFCFCLVLFGAGFVPLMRMLPSTAAILGAVLLHAIMGVPMSFYSQFVILLLAVICTAVSLLVTDGDGFFGGAFPMFVLAVAAIPLAFAFGAGCAGSWSLGIALLGGFAFYAAVSILFFQEAKHMTEEEALMNLSI